MAERELLVRSPGRTELAGNHTDHEGGHVIASAVDRYVKAHVTPREDLVVRIESEGYRPFEVSLESLEPREDERGTTMSLVRGMAAQMVARGAVPQGFDALVTSTVLSGGGLSSSAAFELMLCEAMRALWGAGDISKMEMAQMAQAVERDWFGKPCGLMDQAACALGGIQHMDFSDDDDPRAALIDFDFAAAGYAICIVAVGADHAALTGEYAAVPAEMQAVAAQLGAARLGELREQDVLAALPALRERLGDRPVLRALHFFREERLVEGRAAALRAGDVARFLELTRLSGASSAMYLQNVSVAGAADQPTMLALALADELMGERGACRVHGGGFGGTIQCFVPLEDARDFAAGMDAVLGDGACMICSIDHEGVCSEWL
ncbi:MAG: galactokinase [Olsenella sp.]|nr:galactokinase [Olsenella sp.]